MTFEVALILLAGVAAVSGVARRVGFPAPFALVIAGLGVGVLPGVPVIELDPDLVLLLFLPPLLYAAALSTAFADFRQNLRPIALLSIGLVLVTAGVVGVVAHFVVPNLPYAAAFALGAIVGGYGGSGIARKIGQQNVRRIIIFIGFALTLSLLIKKPNAKIEPGKKTEPAAAARP